ncbi:MAG: hypothetical protein AB8B55_04500, partial [Mariniblastus sp.]
ITTRLTALSLNSSVNVRRWRRELLGMVSSTVDYRISNGVHQYWAIAHFELRLCFPSREFANTNTVCQQL